MSASSSGDSELYGFLYPKKDRQGNQPHFSGNITIEGKLWELAAWKKKAKTGVSYLSLKAQPSGDADTGTQADEVATDPKDEFGF